MAEIWGFSEQDTEGRNSGEGTYHVSTQKVTESFPWWRPGHTGK